MLYDLAIIGGGPAGTAAGVYAARKNLKTVFITESFGGQSVVSDEIQNWVGDVSVSGVELAKRFEKHLRAQEGIEIIFSDKAVKLEKMENGEEVSFKITTEKGKKFETKAVFLAMGAKRRKLNVPGEEEFSGKGVAYCATCDAPLFRGKSVAVVGGGNAGLEAAFDLLSYVEKIYVLEYTDVLRGDEVTKKKLQESGKTEFLMMAEILKIEGEKLVSGLKYKDRKTGEEKGFSAQGVFVEIGSMPNSDLVKDLVKLNERGEIIVDHKTQAASCLGIWAAGDVSDVLYKQNNISAGDAVKAVLNIQEFLNK